MEHALVVLQLRQAETQGQHDARGTGRRGERDDGTEADGGIGTSEGIDAVDEDGGGAVEMLSLDLFPPRGIARRGDVP